MIQQTTLQMVVQAVDNASATLNRVSDNVNGVTKRFEGMSNAVSSLRNTFVGFAVIAGAAKVFQALVDNSVEAQKSIVELEDAIKRTGGSAGVTAAEISKLAGQIQKTSRFSDEAIQDAATRLTLFTNVTGETFARTLKVSADLAARMGTDVPQAAQQLGRALQAPGEGLRVLVQAGIKFNEEQIKTLQYMVETNRIAEAQSIILDELAKRTGGAAAESVKTLGGAFAQLGNQIGELVEAPWIIDKVTAAVSGLARSIADLRASDFGARVKDSFTVALAPLKVLADQALNLAKIIVDPIGAVRGTGLFAPEAPVVGRSKTNRTGAGASRGSGYDPLAAPNAERLAAEAAAKDAKKAKPGDLDEVLSSGVRIRDKMIADIEERTRTSADRVVAEYESMVSDINYLVKIGVEQNGITQEEGLKRLDELNRNFNDKWLSEIVVTAKKVGTAIVSPVYAFTDALKEGLQNAVRSSDFSFKNFINNIIASLLQKRLYDAIDKFGNALAKAMSGGGGGFLASAGKFLGGLFGGRAGGGRASGTFMVGEDGPEMVTSGINSMRVFNQRQLAFAGAGSGGSSPVINYQPQYSISGVDTQQVIAYVERTRKADQKGMLTMLYNNGLGRMR